MPAYSHHEQMSKFHSCPRCLAHRQQWKQVPGGSTQLPAWSFPGPLAFSSLSWKNLFQGCKGTLLFLFILEKSVQGSKGTLLLR